VQDAIPAAWFIRATRGLRAGRIRTATSVQMRNEATQETMAYLEQVVVRMFNG
jgi:hypothetical protein